MSTASSSLINKLWSYWNIRRDDGLYYGEYKVVLYRNQPTGWVAEVPAIAGCYEVMATKTEALAELRLVSAIRRQEATSGGFISYGD